MKCKQCGKFMCWSIYRSNQKYCSKKCRDKWWSLSGNTRKWREKVKLQVYEYLGGAKCKDCGTTDIDVLTYDHVDGGGCKHRKSKNVSRCGEGLHCWLWSFVKKNKPIPIKIEIVCRNCNWKRHLRKLRK